MDGTIELNVETYEVSWISTLWQTRDLGVMQKQEVLVSWNRLGQI